nr:hypothetical protein [Bacteroidales bacterium]
FATFRQLPFILHQELFLANIIARNGGKVTMILDDGLFDHWDTYQYSDNQKQLNPLKSKNRIFNNTYLNSKFLKVLYKNKNINFIYTSEILRENKDFRLDPKDEHAVSSTKRFFQTGEVDLKKNSFREYYHLSLENSKKSERIGKYCVENLNIDVFITSHGIYSLWGPIYEQLKKTGIPSYIYGTHVYTESDILLTDTLAQTLSFDSKWSNFKNANKPLTKKEKIEVKRIINQRLDLKFKDTNIYHNKQKNGQDEYFPNKNSNGDKIRFGHFPNVIWDGDIVQRDKIFNGMLDWIIKTIRIFYETDNELVVRFHPAESTLWKESKKLKEVVLEHFPDIYGKNNITLIDSSVSLNTYDLIKNHIDVGLIYDGILSLELTYLNKPVISVSNGRFTNNGFLIEPRNFDEYKALISYTDWVKEYVPENMKEHFYRYAYWFFKEAGYYLPIFDETKYGTIQIGKNTLNKIETNKFYRTIDRLISLQ